PRFDKAEMGADGERARARNEADQFDHIAFIVLLNFTAKRAGRGSRQRVRGLLSAGGLHRNNEKRAGKRGTGRMRDHHVRSQPPEAAETKGDARRTRIPRSTAYFFTPCVIDT